MVIGAISANALLHLQNIQRQLTADKTAQYRLKNLQNQRRIINLSLPPGQGSNILSVEMKSKNDSVDASVNLESGEVANVSYSDSGETGQAPTNEQLIVLVENVLNDLPRAVLDFIFSPPKKQ